MLTYPALEESICDDELTSAMTLEVQMASVREWEGVRHIHVEGWTWWRPSRRCFRFRLPLYVPAGAFPSKTYAQPASVQLDRSPPDFNTPGP